MFSTFFLLKPGTDAKKLEAKFPAFVDKYMGTGLKAAGFYKKQFLLPVKDIHLYAGMTNDISPVGSVTYLYILASIALFTLLIACINFMNLSTASSSKRSAEVGIRKVLGAEKSSLIKQFLGESLLMSLIAFCIALVITAALLACIFACSGRNLSLDFVERLVHYCRLFRVINHYRFACRKLSRLLSFFISAGESFERKIYKFLICGCFKKRIGDFSIHHFCCADNCFGCYHESNELFALNRSWFCKRPANSNSTQKHYCKKYLCFFEE